MADRTSVAMTIGGNLPRSLVAELVEIANAERMGTDYDGPQLSEEDVLASAAASGNLKLFGSEIAGGSPDALERLLQARGLTYRKQWDAHYAFPAGGELWTGSELHPYCAEGTDSSPLLSVEQISAFPTMEALRRWMDELNAPIPPLVIVDDGHEYLFDVKAFLSVRVRAHDEASAKKALRDTLDAVTVNAGAWANGEPILCELSMDDGEADLLEIDGENV